PIPNWTQSLIKSITHDVTRHTRFKIIITIINRKQPLTYNNTPCDDCSNCAEGFTDVQIQVCARLYCFRFVAFMTRRLQIPAPALVSHHLVAASCCSNCSLLTGIHAQFKHFRVLVTSPINVGNIHTGGRS
ncbi:hypothetical protein JOB18_027594, partial [Solea senegalensis]